MEIPIEISVDEEKPKRRGVPPRFAAMLKEKEAAATPIFVVEEQPKAESASTDGINGLNEVKFRFKTNSSSSCQSSP